MRHLLGLLILAVALLPRTTSAAPPRVLLLSQGPDGHPPETHEYVAGLKVLKACLDGVGGLDVTTVRADGDWKEGPELIGRSDGVVLYLAEGARWVSEDAKRLEAFKLLARRGGGLVVLHWGMGTREAAPVDPFVALFGGCHGGPDRKYKVVETEVKPEKGHPVTSGMAPFKIRDEFYYRLKFVPAKNGVRPILTAAIDGADETVAWGWDRPDGGRSFGFSGLHFHDGWRREEYRRLITQGVLWTLKAPIPEKGVAVKLREDVFALPASGKP